MSEFSSCGRCGRKLKTAKSMQDGFGPVCKRKHEAEQAANQLTFEEELEANDNGED